MVSSRIQQIMPASDWYAVIAETDEQVVHEPVVCFALVVLDEETEVRPMIWVDTAVVFADELDGFVDLEHADQLAAELLEEEEYQAHPA